MEEIERNTQKRGSGMEESISKLKMMLVCVSANIIKEIACLEALSLILRFDDESDGNGNASNNK